MGKRRRIEPSLPLFEEMVALTSTVRTMRRARGRKIPRTFHLAAQTGTSPARDFCATCTQRWKAIRTSWASATVDLSVRLISSCASGSPARTRTTCLQRASLATSA